MREKIDKKRIYLFEKFFFDAINGLARAELNLLSVSYFSSSGKFETNYDLLICAETNCFCNQNLLPNRIKKYKTKFRLVSAESADTL